MKDIAEKLIEWHKDWPDTSEGFRTLVKAINEIQNLRKELAEARAALREAKRFVDAYPVSITVKMWKARYAIALKAALEDRP